jgi:hypothetical protein
MHRATPTQNHKTEENIFLLAGNQVLLEGTHESTLLSRGLVSTVTELGRGVDPLEVDLLVGLAADLWVEGLAQSHDTLLNTRDGALDDNEVVLDLTVADEATKTVKES